MVWGQLCVYGSKPVFQMSGFPAECFRTRSLLSPRVPWSELQKGRNRSCVPGAGNVSLGVWSPYCILAQMQPWAAPTFKKAGAQEHVPRRTEGM